MKMTNERAKEILDMLTKKAGYSNFSFVDLTSGRIAPLVSKDGNSSHLFIVPSKISLTTRIDVLTYENGSTFEDVLHDMLNYVEAGSNYIETNKINDVFMPAYATLEQLEIMMDLENENDK